MSSSFSKHVVPPAYSSDSKSSEVRDYIRKSFPVKAIQLTDKNVEMVAAFCHGEISWFKGDGHDNPKPIVLIPANKKDAKPAEARVNDYVICIPRAGRNKQDVFAVYNKHAFGRAFDLKPTDEELADAVVETINVKDWARQEMERNLEVVDFRENKDVVGVEEQIKAEPSIRFNPGDEETPKLVAAIFEGQVSLQSVLETSSTVGEVLQASGQENARIAGIDNDQLVIEDGTILPKDFVENYDFHLANYVRERANAAFRENQTPRQLAAAKIQAMADTMEAQLMTLRSLYEQLYNNREQMVGVADALKGTGE